MLISFRALLLACLSVLPLGGLMIPVGTDAEAKTPGNTYCFNRKCHRVKSLAETRKRVGRDETVVTSHYDDCKRDRYNPCGLTSSGEVFRAGAADNAASPVYPDGTTVLVWSPRSQSAAVLRINNAGPYHSNRKLDVSRGAARKLGFSGIARLKMRVLDAPTYAEARYKRRRRYAPVLGYIGKYNSLDDANTAVAAMLAVEQMAKAVRTDVPKSAIKTSRTQIAALARQGSTLFASADNLPTRSGATPQPKAKPQPLRVALLRGRDVEAPGKTGPATASLKRSPVTAIALPERKPSSSETPAETVRVAKAVIADDAAKAKETAQKARSVANAQRAAKKRKAIARKKLAAKKRLAKQRKAKKAKIVLAQQRHARQLQRAAAARKKAAQAKKLAEARRKRGPNDMSIFTRHRIPGVTRFYKRKS